jgi:hypothetical protein
MGENDTGRRDGMVRVGCVDFGGGWNARKGVCMGFYARPSLPVRMRVYDPLRS